MINMTKRKKIWLIVIVVVLVLVSVLSYWQRNNIKAVYKAFTLSGEELANEINKGKQLLEKEIKEQYPSVISDFSAEEEEKIISGEWSMEDVDDILAQRKAEMENALKNEGNSGTKPSGNSPSSNPNAEKIEAAISEKVLELYSLKAYYLGQLGQIEASVKKDYMLLPKEKQNLIGKKELVNQYIGVATGLLNQCDKQVFELLDSLEKQLKNLGGDTSIIGKIKSAYEDEKSLKKAYYIQLMNQ